MSAKAGWPSHVTEDVASSPDLTDAERPAVWIPDAASWLSVARDAGAGDIVPESGTTVGASDIVLAMPEPLADAIGWDEDAPTWDEVFTASEDVQLWADLGHPEWGGFQLGKTSPVVASSGEASMLVSYGSASGSVADLSVAEVEDEAVTQTVREHELAVSHYMATPEHFLWHARQAEARGGSAAEFLSAVIVDEKSVWDYNRGIVSRDGVTRVEDEPPAEKLVAIYPTDGFYVADNPAVVLTGPWVSEAQQAAAADFIRYAGTEQGQQIVRDYGYRDLNGVLSDEVAEVGTLEPAPVGVLPFPGQDVIVAVHEAFPDVRKRANVLFLIDVSGSMDDVLESGQTRLEGAKDAITLALDHFAAGDDVGLAAFSSGGDGVMIPGLVSPVQDIGDSREEFLAALDGLEAVAYTPLYEAVDTFSRDQSQAYDPSRINAIVLLSDGTNNTAVPTTTEDEMLATLDEVSHTLLVFTLAYGADADVERAMPVFDALRPDGPREEGFSHVGPVGAGHYAKMVHNGVEYALMQAYAEGYELLAKRSDLVTDVEATFAGWQRGTVVRSWLLELLVRALEEDPELDDIRGYVNDSGEGRWTVEEAIDQAVPVPTISAAIFARFVSRQEDSPAMRAVASLRNQFGGHAVTPAGE